MHIRDITWEQVKKEKIESITKSKTIEEFCDAIYPSGLDVVEGKTFADDRERLFEFLKQIRLVSKLQKKIGLFNLATEIWNIGKQEVDDAFFPSLRIAFVNTGCDILEIEASLFFDKCSEFSISSRFTILSDESIKNTNEND